MPEIVSKNPGKATFAPANGTIIPTIVADAGDYAARRFLRTACPDASARILAGDAAWWGS